MIDGVPLTVMDLSGWGVAVFVLLLLTVLVLRGKIPSQSALEAERRRADVFEQAWEKSQEALRAKDEAWTELIQNSRTTVKILEGIQEEAQKGRGDSG